MYTRLPFPIARFTRIQTNSHTDTYVHAYVQSYSLYNTPARLQSTHVLYPPPPLTASSCSTYTTPLYYSLGMMVLPGKLYISRRYRQRYTYIPLQKLESIVYSLEDKKKNKKKK